MADRREFLAALMATAVVSQAGVFAEDSSLTKSVGVNLVPEEPCSKPNYWCTWAAQNYMYGHDLPNSTLKLEGDSGSRLAHDAMSEETLFGRTGWAKTSFRRFVRCAFPPR